MRTLLGSTSVSKPTGGKNAAMLLHLPHGLFNPAGVTMSVDAAKPEAFAIRACDAKGCRAGAPRARHVEDMLRVMAEPCFPSPLFGWSSNTKAGSRSNAGPCR